MKALILEKVSGFLNIEMKVWHYLILSILLLTLGIYIAKDRDNKFIIEATEKYSMAMIQKKDAENKIVLLEQEKQSILISESEKKSQVTELLNQIEQNKQLIIQLQQQKKESQLSVRQLQTQADILDKFADVFPKLTRNSNYGLTKLVADNGISLSYVVLPVGHLDTFINLGLSIKNLELQIAEYKDNENNYGSVVKLHDELNDLKDKYAALVQNQADGYKDLSNSAFQYYKEANEDHIACRKEPRLKMPSKIVTVGVGVAAFAGGYFACDYLNKNPAPVFRIGKQW